MGFVETIPDKVLSAWMPHMCPELHLPGHIGRGYFCLHSSHWVIGGSLKLLEWLLEKFNPVRGTKMLAIFDIDAFTSGFDFVFGEAYYRGRLAATYISRLKLEFYGLKPNPSLFYERLVKEAIHELGHTFGFIHCKNSRCVMYFSTALGDIDTKERSVCKKCNKKYFR